MKTIIAFSIIALATAGLAKAAGEKPETEKQEAKAEPAFKVEGDYTFKVTHQAKDLDVQFPSSPIPNAAYKAEKGLELRFSVQGAKLTLEMKEPSMGTTKPMKESGKGVDERIYKTLDPDLSGSYQMSLKRTKDGVVGTLTSFGSGLPVLFSWRGVVAKDEASKGKPKK